MKLIRKQTTKKLFLDLVSTWLQLLVYAEKWWRYYMHESSRLDIRDVYLQNDVLLILHFSVAYMPFMRWYNGNYLQKDAYNFKVNRTWHNTQQQSCNRICTCTAKLGSVLDYYIKYFVFLFNCMFVWFLFRKKGSMRLMEYWLSFRCN